MESPNIEIVLPGDLVSDFLGTLTIDVLHDAKGHGILVGQPLHKLTDLLAQSVFLHSGLETRGDISLWIFKMVFQYLWSIWQDNTKALIISPTPPDFNNNNPDYWSSWYQSVKLPIRSVADRLDDDTFISLGRNKKMVEAENYFHQSSNHITYMFISPRDNAKPINHYQEAQKLVTAIAEHVSPAARVALDMKSAAGLLRTITDPLGYITGLATYADPGYSMPGMSAIRNNSLHAINGGQTFNYTIKLDSPFGVLSLLSVEYYYGVAGSAAPPLERNNVLMNILGETFTGRLPRSREMAFNLGNYLHPMQHTLTFTVQDVLLYIKSALWTRFEQNYNNLFMEKLDCVYRELSRSETPKKRSITVLFDDLDMNLPASLWRWLTASGGSYLRRFSYILATLKHIRLFNLEAEFLEGLLPKDMISVGLPSLMAVYQKTGSINMLAFCYHQWRLLQQFIGTSSNAPFIPFEQNLATLLSETSVLGSRAKLVNKIKNCTVEWRRSQQNGLLASQKNLEAFLQKLLNHSKRVLERFAGPDSSNSADILLGLPVYNPTKKLQKILAHHLLFYQPELHAHFSSDTASLYLYSFLDSCLWKKPLVTLQRGLQETISKGSCTAEPIELMQDSLKIVLGKFSGDFGQIVWCMRYGHIFASEDNNTSAMASLLHKLPKQCITFDVAPQTPAGVQQKWASIHGWGDGGRVDVTIS